MHVQVWKGCGFGRVKSVPCKASPVASQRGCRHSSQVKQQHSCTYLGLCMPIYVLEHGTQNRMVQQSTTEVSIHHTRQIFPSKHGFISKWQQHRTVFHCDIQVWHKFMQTNTLITLRCTKQKYICLPNWWSCNFTAILSILRDTINLSSMRPDCAAFVRIRIGFYCTFIIDMYVPWNRKFRLFSPYTTAKTTTIIYILYSCTYCSTK